MARKESTQKRLLKVRPPRVQLSYEVEKGDAIEHKELPFVVGVLGDFSGNPEQPLPKVKERRFVNVDLDTFDDVMEAVAPRAVFRVPNRISAEGGEFGVELKFRCIQDFRPESVVRQVQPLRRLLEIRMRLADLRNRLAGNERLEDLLLEALANPEQLQQLRLSHEAKGE